MSLRSMIIEFALLYFLFNRSRNVDVFLPLDGELYKIQGCAACYSQCRTILKGPWKGLK